MYVNKSLKHFYYLFFNVNWISGIIYKLQLRIRYLSLPAWRHFTILVLDIPKSSSILYWCNNPLPCVCLFFQHQSFARHKLWVTFNLLLVQNLKILKSFISVFPFSFFCLSLTFHCSYLGWCGIGGATSSERLKWAQKSRVFSGASWLSTVQLSGNTFPQRSIFFLFSEWVKRERGSVRYARSPSGAQTKPQPENWK